jgi:hypothetical protein
VTAQSGQLPGDIYNAAFERRPRLAIYEHRHASDVAELDRFVPAVARWERPILRWHRAVPTGAATKGTNPIIKNIIRLSAVPPLRTTIGSDSCSAAAPSHHYTSYQHDPAPNASARRAGCVSLLSGALRCPTDSP